MDQQKKTKLFFFPLTLFIFQVSDIYTTVSQEVSQKYLSVIKAVKCNDLSSQDVDIRHELLNRFKHTGKFKPPVINAGK